MKQVAITLRQPWAWAVIMGHKKVENRPRRTTREGEILIHAGQTLDPKGFQFLWEMGLHRKLPDDLPTGALIGTVLISDCFKGSTSPWALRGYWHWILKAPREFNTPIPCAGKQGFFVPEVSGPSLGAARRNSRGHSQRGA